MNKSWVFYGNFMIFFQLGVFGKIFGWSSTMPSVMLLVVLILCCEFQQYQCIDENMFLLECSISKTIEAKRSAAKFLALCTENKKVTISMDNGLGAKILYPLPKCGKLSIEFIF